MKFLIIEDDTEIIEFISLALDLGWHDAEIVTINRGNEARERLTNDPPDIVLLDLGLPDISGFEVLKEIRAYSNIPVIIITVTDSEESIVKGLNLGADEYIVKPFGQLELLARIRAVFRNRNNHYQTPISSGLLKYYPESCKLICGSKDIHLTRTECLIINELLSNQGKIVTYSQLADTIWGDYYPNAPEAIRVYIRRLRLKIEKEPGCAGIIISKPGLGYILDLPSLNQ